MKEPIKIFIFFGKLLQNPVYLKDIRQFRRSGKKQFILQAWLLYVGVLLFAIAVKTFYHSTSSVNLFSFIILFQTFFYAVRGSLRAYPLFVREREQRTMDGLNCTLLASKDIIIGKFMAAFNDLALELTYILPLFILAGFLTGTPATALAAVYLITLINLVIGVSTGLFFSLKASSLREARNSSILDILFLWGIQFQSIIGMATLYILVMLTSPTLIFTHAFDDFFIKLATNVKEALFAHPVYIIINPFNSLTTLIFFNMHNNETAIPFHPLMILFSICVFVLYALLIRFFYGRTVKLLDKTMNMDNPVPERV